MDSKVPKAIIIGASSGIGRALALVLSNKGYEIGLAARRIDLLRSLQEEIKTKSYLQQLDVTQAAARSALERLIHEMKEVDLIVVNAGVYCHNRQFGWETEEKTIQVNVLGFASMAHKAFEYFSKRGTGHIVGISSISALRGEAQSPSYSASKAFVSNFLEGLRVKAHRDKKQIVVTDIQPGWVDTEMARGEETFWMAPVRKAADQIYLSIKHKQAHAYITRRWRFYAWLLKLIPNWLYPRL